MAAAQPALAWPRVSGSFRVGNLADVMTKADVREKKVLHKCKFQGESQLFAHHADTINHAAAHQRSNCCWRPAWIDAPRDRAKRGSTLESNDGIVSIKNVRARVMEV